MPYARPEDRLAAKRRYNASPKGRATSRRYYLANKPQQIKTNPAPLAQALKEWKQ
jgi:hypothetical protein